MDMLHLTQGEKNEQKMIPTAYRDIGRKKKKPLRKQCGSYYLQITTIPKVLLD